MGAYSRRIQPTGSLEMHYPYCARDVLENGRVDGA
jgi:hypothetical protein